MEEFALGSELVQVLDLVKRRRGARSQIVAIRSEERNIAGAVGVISARVEIVGDGYAEDSRAFSSIRIEVVSMLSCAL